MIGGVIMTFFQQNSRRGPYGAGFNPYQGIQGQPYYYNDQFRQGPQNFFLNQGSWQQPNFYPNGGWQGQPNLFENNFNQAQRFGGLPGNLNTIMGHVGTVTNGVNMVRQLGAIMSLFR